MAMYPLEGDEGCDLGHSGTLEAEERPGRKSQRTLRNTPVGQPYLRALDDRCQPGVPPTDDFGGPLGKWVLSATAESNTAVPVGPPRPSSITHPEAAPATVTCSYIVGWHRWTRGWGNLVHAPQAQPHDMATTKPDPCSESVPPDGVRGH